MTRSCFFTQGQRVWLLCDLRPLSALNSGDGRVKDVQIDQPLPRSCFANMAVLIGGTGFGSAGQTPQTTSMSGSAIVGGDSVLATAAEGHGVLLVESVFQLGPNCGFEHFQIVYSVFGPCTVRNARNVRFFGQGPSRNRSRRHFHAIIEESSKLPMSPMNWEIV